jgi:trimeric autotransporter adhesin
MKPMTNITHIALALSALAWFALSPSSIAVDPPPDGGYPNQNTAEGEDALLSGGNLSNNTAIGYHAIYSELYGGDNTAVGASALELLYDAAGNTAVGSQAMSANTDSDYNTAVGNQALGAINRYADSMNTAVGYHAMAFATAFGCTAIGYYALNVTERENNVAIGNESLTENSTGTYNTGVGWRSLFLNSTGFGNVGIGDQALFSSESGNQNVALGDGALLNNTTGSNNIAIGADAGTNLTRGDNNISIGNGGMTGDSGVIRIGTAGSHTALYVAGVLSSPVASATGVGITPDGQLGVRASSIRYKEAIKPMDKASEAIFSLRPVTFRYKKALEPKGVPQFGLVAEEVAKVNPDLVLADSNGKPYTVRYDEVNAMLLNEFLKEHHKVEEQGALIAQQRKDFEAKIAQQQKQIEALTAGLQKVTARLERSKPATRVVSDN